MRSWLVITGGTHGLSVLLGITHVPPPYLVEAKLVENTIASDAQGWQHRRLNWCREIKVDGEVVELIHGKCLWLVQGECVWLVQGEC